MPQLTIRDVEADDIPKLKALIDDTWAWDDLADDETVLDALLGLYLNQVLYDSSFGKVAVLDGELAGAIFGCVEGDVPSYRMLQEDGTEHSLTLLNAAEHERRDIYTCMSTLNATYARLLDGKTYDGTLVFLAVAENAQGLGVGKALWHALASYFRERQAERISVFSDTDCNFGFYEHSGFSKRETQALTCTFSKEVWQVDVYLYEYQFPS